MSDLALFSDGTETYVASSVEEARKMQFDLCGENPEPETEWSEVSKNVDRTLTIHTDDGEGPVSKTVGQWIKDNGPGFLCSTEY